MAGEWSTMRLGEFVTLQRGHDLPEERRRSGDVPVLGSFGITGWHDEAQAPGPGVTVGRSGASFGVVNYSAVDFWPLNTALYVIDFHGNDPRFAYYFLQTFDFARFNSGSAQPSLNRNFIHPVEVCVPTRDKQVAIADLLGALDDKIELNGRMAGTVEAMARALFKSWFIDFDPVHAKAEGRPTGLPDDLAALFPDGFGEDGLPAGWTAAPLSDLADLQRATVEPADLGEAAVDHYSLPAFDEGVWPASESASTIKSLKLALDPPLVLFSKLNPEIPRVWPVLGGSGRPMLASTEFLAMKPRTGRATLAYLASLLASYAFRERAAGMVTGTSKSHQRVQPAALLQCACIAPDASILSGFDEVSAPILSRIDGLRRQSRNLTQLRDTLLPKLISGELRIAGAEQVVKAVA